MATKERKMFWQAQPYPHIIIPNFMSNSIWIDMLSKVRSLDSSEPYAKFDTNIQRGKTTFNKDSRLGNILEPVANALISPAWLKILAPLVVVSEDILPLSIYKDEIDYKYFHQMNKGGILGSHVDHSQVYSKDSGLPVDNKIHFLNCIYYLTTTHGGSTELYGSAGFGKPLETVPCSANTLLIFLHTSQSFHGVSRVLDLYDNIPRTTVYMDYYTNKHGISQLQTTANKECCNFTPDWWKHRTTFVPKDWMRMHLYLPWYLEWMMRRPIV